MDYTNKQLQVIFGDGSLGLSGKDFHYIFSYDRGGMESLVVRDKEWLYRTSKPAFWRATTDNDHGSGFSVKSAQWYAADKFSTCQDMKISVDGKELPELPIAPINNKYSNEEFANEVSITFTYETNTVPSTTVSITYNVKNDGEIKVDFHFSGNAKLPELPVLGMSFIMPTVAKSFDYDGLSGETYPDRMAGAVPGTFHIKGLPVTPYLVPQDCGMHMETSSVTINRDSTQNNADHNQGEFSLTFEQVDKNFAFSCLPYTAQELENATHIEELPLKRRTVFNIYGGVRGVGGIDSWGADVENAYHVSAQNDLDFSFKIKF